MSQQADSVSQYGITREFDGGYTVGQYANGDCWVEGPVTITNVAPESTEVGERLRGPLAIDGATPFVAVDGDGSGGVVREDTPVGGVSK